MKQNHPTDVRPGTLTALLDGSHDNFARLLSSLPFISRPIPVRSIITRTCQQIFGKGTHQNANMRPAHASPDTKKKRDVPEAGPAMKANDHRPAHPDLLCSGTSPHGLRLENSPFHVISMILRQLSAFGGLACNSCIAARSTV